MDPHPADLGTAKTTSGQSNRKVKPLRSLLPATIMSVRDIRTVLPQPTPGHEVPLREPCHVQLIVSEAGGRGRQECWAPSGVRRMKLCRVASPSWSPQSPPSSIYQVSAPTLKYRLASRAGPWPRSHLRAPPQAQALGLLSLSHLGSALPFPSKL